MKRGQERDSPDDERRREVDGRVCGGYVSPVIRLSECWGGFIKYTKKSGEKPNKSIGTKRFHK